MSTSVSKGVFVFQGKIQAAKSGDYFGDKATTHGSAFALKRHQTCANIWADISEEIQTLQTDLNTKIFEELLQFTEDAHKKFCVGDDGSSTSCTPEIPTAALITGVNMQDHDLMFSNLTSLLKGRVTPYVAVLQSKDCPNVRSIMNKTITQFMQKSNMVLEDEEEEDAIHLKRMSCTMPVLAAWYADVCQKQKTPSPKKKHCSSELSASPKYPPLVVMLEDLEGFSPHALQDFISICSNNLHHLPLVLVLGIATTVTAVHHLLPHAVSSLLCMEKFQAPPSTEFLAQVISQVVMTPRVPFKLGSRVFQFLLDLFLYHDFSVVSFIRGLQVCLLEHFQLSPSSILCQPVDEAVHTLQSMSCDEVEMLKCSAPIVKLLESKKSEDVSASAEDVKQFKVCVTKWLRDLEEYHSNFFPVLECLHVFTGKLPGYPLGKQLREIYCLCLNNTVCDLEEYKQSLSLLRTLSRDELLSMTKQCKDILHQKGKMQSLSETVSWLESTVEKLTTITDMTELVESQDEEEDAAAALPKKTDMYTLRKHLKDMVQKKKKYTKYEALRNETVDYFDEIFRTHLTCHKLYPLHEVLYFDDLPLLKRCIVGCPRASLQTALSDPYVYLQNEKLLHEGGLNWEAMPDICIVYKLHLECGRLINMYDWLQAFITVVEASDNQKKKSKQKKPDTVLQARFIRAVSELQFLGFIKPTKRKTDHVARLTWGGC